MLTSFVLTMALAAPVPAPPAPVASGPLPRLMELKADASGKVVVTVVRIEMQKVQVGIGAAIAPGGGAAPPAVVTREVPVQKIAQVELGEVKDLKITTADGKKVDVADAVAKVKGGATVVVSADGQPVSPNHLKLFKDDVLVFAAPELAAANGINGGINIAPGFPGKPIRPLPPVQIQPLPAPIAPGGIQVLPAAPAGGVIQVQIAPGGVQVLPAPVAPPVDKLPPKREEK
jgi:hypothetical protein